VLVGKIEFDDLAYGIVLNVDDLKQAAFEEIAARYLLDQLSQQQMEILRRTINVDVTIAIAALGILGVVVVGQDNVIAVKVSNANDPNIAPFYSNHAPDWTKFGGLYRDVHLLVTNTLQVNPLDRGSAGIFIKQSGVSAASADLSITAEVRNGGGASRSATVKTVLVDKSGSIVKSMTSSAFTVGLLHALHAYRGKQACPAELAAAACEVEIGRLGEPIGKQDQYASAYGGLNYIRFLPDDSVDVETIELSQSARCEFESRLMLFSIGQERAASSILDEQTRNMSEPGKIALVTRMVEFASYFQRALRREQFEECGHWLNENWKLKRELANGISPPVVEQTYARAMAAGAAGGKLLGAGNSGFLLLYCHPGKQSEVREALKTLKEMPFRFSNAGSEVIFSDDQAASDTSGRENFMHLRQ